ncbi:MAG TPA: hypothetical protein PK995_09625 [Bacteroidia bacterium]|nr:hypothetical protein [Bacteroidia bacterium]
MFYQTNFSKNNSKFKINYYSHKNVSVYFNQKEKINEQLLQKHFEIKICLSNISKTGYIKTNFYYTSISEKIKPYFIITPSFKYEIEKYFECSTFILFEIIWKHLIKPAIIEVIEKIKTIKKNDKNKTKSNKK